MQVWLGRKLMGWLETAIPQEGRMARWYLTARGPSPTPSENPISLNRYIDVPVIQRKCELTRLDAAMLGSEIKILSKLVDDFHCDVESCTKSVELRRDVQIYTWDVLHPITLEAFEFLFDLPEFVPA